MRAQTFHEARCAKSNHVEARHLHPYVLYIVGRAERWPYPGVALVFVLCDASVGEELTK